MAEINYYADIDLNNGQVKNFKVDNSTSFPSIAGVGQLRYDTGNSVLKYHTGGGTWVTIGTSSGGVTSISVANGGTSSGTALSANQSTGAVTISSLAYGGSTNVGHVPTGGGATTFLRGDGAWATPAGAYTSWTLAGDSGSSQAIADGNTATFAGGTGITTAASATDTLTITNSKPFDKIVTAADSGTSNITNNDTITISGGTGITTADNGSGTITITASGSGTMSSWTLSGDSGSSQTISDGNTVDIAGGTGVSTAASSTDTLTVNIDMVGTDNYIEVNAAAAIASGDYLAFSDINDSNTVKKITYANLFSGYMQGFFIDGDTNGGAVTATNNYMDIAGGTAISTNWTGVGSGPQVQTITVNHDTFGSAGTYTYPSSVTTNATGHITAITSGSAPGTMSSWTLAGDSGSSQTISNGNTATFIGGTGITTAASATDDLTITNSKPFDSITLAADSGSNSTIVNSGTITIVGGSNISTTNNGSGSVTVAYTGGTGTMSSFTLAGDTGSTQTISNGDTLTVAGSQGIDTVASATDTVEVNLDLNELTTVTTIDPAVDFLVGVDGTASTNEKIEYSDVHLDQWGDAEADVDFGGNKLLDVATGTAGTDGVNLAQVQSIAAGVGVFQGGYNAITNNPVLTGGSNIALDQGDYYAVTDSNQSSFLGTVVEVGDLIFANNAISASSSPTASDYTIVQSGQSIAGSGATDGATVKGIAGFDNANFTVTGNGWVSLNNQGTNGNYGSASETVTLAVNADGIITSASEQNIAITSGQVTNFCTDVETCVNSAFFYQVTFGNTNDTDYAISHGFNTLDVMCQIYDVSTGDTIYAEVERTNTSTVTVKSNSAPGTNAWRILVTNVSG